MSHSIRFLPLAAAATLVLAACASPEVDTAALDFDAARYAGDLDTCRGGGAVDFALKITGAAFAGSAIGALQGVSYGVMAGASEEGAIIGAAVGGVIGLGVGAVGAVDDEVRSVETCLDAKGYALLAE